MADRLNLTVTIKAVDAGDNSAFYDHVQTYSGLHYADFVAIQKLGTAFLAQLNALGEQKAQGKK